MAKLEALLEAEDIFAWKERMDMVPELQAISAKNASAEQDRQLKYANSKRRDVTYAVGKKKKCRLILTKNRHNLENGTSVRWPIYSQQTCG